MIYTAECRIRIMTDNKEKFDDFVGTIRKNYGSLTSDKLPDDVDIDFEFNIHKEVVFDDIEGDEE